MILYAGAAGVSQVALLMSVAFWTWLWGPLGLLMATPLTVCLVVLGKHVKGLEFLATLMADQPALAPEYGYYQRLLARDQDEAAELVERHIRTEAPHTVFDALLLPALNYAERDRMEGRLSPGEEANVVEATGELTADAADLHPPARTRRSRLAADTPLLAPREPLRVLGYATKGIADQLALRMLSHLLEGFADPDRDHEDAHAGARADSAGSRSRRVGGLSRRPAAEPDVKDPLSRQTLASGVSGRADSRRPLVSRRAGRRKHITRSRPPARITSATSLVESRDELVELIELPRKKVLEAKSSADIVVPTPPPAPAQPAAVAAVPVDPKSRRS